MCFRTVYHSSSTLKCYKSDFLFKEWELVHHIHLELAAGLCIYPQGLSSLLPSNISAQAGQSLSTDDVCRKHSFMLTALKNQSLKMSRYAPKLAQRDRQETTSWWVLWEGLRCWKWLLFYWGRSAGDVKPVFVFLSFWWHGMEVLWADGEQPGLQKPCRSSPCARMWDFQGMDHCGVCWNKGPALTIWWELHKSCTNRLLCNTINHGRTWL